MWRRIAVGGDLEVEVVVAADPLGALDGAREDVVPRLRRRERAEVVLAEQERARRRSSSSSSSGRVIHQRAAVLERRRARGD